MPQQKPFHYFHAEQAKQEAAAMSARRSEQASPVDPDPIDDEQAARAIICNAKGLALSGGGIRSSTFNLGILQSLAAAGHLKTFDILSTVSGGGYIGSFLGRLYHRSAQETPGAPPVFHMHDVERVLASDEAPIVRWLRDNGRYLAPHGLKDQLFAVGIYLRNLLSVHVLLGVMLLAMMLVWTAIRGWLGSFHSTAAFGYLPDGSGISPLWGGTLVLFATFFSCAWSYWMHRKNTSMGREQQIIASALAIIATLALFGQLPEYVTQIVNRLHPNLILGAIVIGAGAIVVSLVVGLGVQGTPAIRNRISKWQRTTLWGLIVITLFALLDDATYRIYLALGQAHAPYSGFIGAGLTGGLLAGLRALIQNFATRLESHQTAHTSSGKWMSRLINLIGLLLIALVAFGWAYAAQAYLWAGVKLGATPNTVWPLLAAALPLWVLVALAGRHLDVLNLSSLHTFYAARLARAYLGAGNPRRGIAWSTTPMQVDQMVPVSQVDHGDDPNWQDYAPQRYGGPMHLINVNVNQTRYSSSGHFQPDRQGWNMALGPGGFNLGRSRWQASNWHEAESLPLSQWIAISGAAFTTGAGPRTGAGFSALLGLLGVRLGFWWRAGNSNPSRKKPHMLSALWQEITGAFNPDDQSHWYLSDGGHFENTATYELIRRRVKRIVMTDCGADPGYIFEDIANLVLKARIDFNAEISFLSNNDLDTLWQNHPNIRDNFCEPDTMCSTDSTCASQGPSLLLARIKYSDDPIPGWLLIVKPRLPSRLPTDLTYYINQQQSFPQQSTLDQFYDEAQWESTHKLGRILGEQLTQALDALPVWMDPAAKAAMTITGTRHTTKGPPKKAPPASTSDLVKIYAPIIIALWTGFEFYSNYQQERAKETAETTRFALARIDVLERQVLGPNGCADNGDLKKCPTLPGQTLLIRQMLADLPPTTAKPLNEIVAQLENAANVSKPRGTDLATTVARTVAHIAPAAPATSLLKADPKLLERALVYLQIYDETQRDPAQLILARLRQNGLNAAQLPGIENVFKTTQAMEAKTPTRVDSTTIIYYHDTDKPIAEWVAQNAFPDKTETVNLRNLSDAYPNVRPGLVELWLP